MGRVGKWVLFDYGGVLCTPQPEADRAALVALAGAGDAGEFWAAYWAHRDAYDKAELTPAAYWTAVLGSEPADLDALDAADVAGWSHPYEETLALLPRLRAGLALLSNAPASLATAVDAMAWTDLVPHRFYSCRLGATKPDPAAYEAVLAALGAEPGQVTFVDDRPANVAGAAAVGLRAVHFTGPAALAAELDLQGDT
jgi:putative hydrolase of the HAD superfamily